jgi:asparagine synthase (glutamine-hydrolysing)
METPDGRFTIVFNGEIYNYRDVRSELEANGDRFVTGSDTEVILQAYARWGSECPRHLRGMFAFGIWDARDCVLFLARDRLGVKPLYVASVKGGLIFASEVRAILATGRVERKLDSNGLAGYLAFGSVREPDTMVHGVQMLPSGSSARWREGVLQTRTYWTPPLGTDRSVSRGTAIAETRVALRDSVGLRLVSDVPVGIFLSGGMDSGAILALASQVSTRTVHTFTVTFDEDVYNEGEYAREVAAAFGAEHHVIHLSSQRALERIDDALAALDQPSVDGTNTYFVAEGVRQAGLTVALSGIGGDELFAGYTHFRRFRAVMRARRALERLPRRLANLASQELLSTAARKGLSLLGTSGDPFGVYAVLRGVFVTEQRRALLSPGLDASYPRTAFDEAVSRWARTDQADALAAFGFLDSTNYLKNTLLRDTDVMGMAHALEVREPLLDHVLVERLLTLPGSFKLARDINKPLLAEAVPELPAATTRRKKMGFTLPLAMWLRGPLRGWAADKLKAAAVVGLEAGEVARIWKAFLDGRLSFSYAWALIALADWSRREGISL